MIEAYVILGVTLVLFATAIGVALAWSLRK